MPRRIISRWSLMIRAFLARRNPAGCPCARSRASRNIQHRSEGFFTGATVLSCRLFSQRYEISNEFNRKLGWIEVHRDKGPGLIESIYEWCLLHELGLRGPVCISQKSVLIHYKGF